MTREEVRLPPLPTPNDSAAMKRPFQFSLRTIIGVAGLLCTCAWFFAQSYGKSPKDNAAAPFVFAGARMLIAAIAWL